jgi:acetyl/propionyl-CoA carboxylase alpha subunit
MTNIISPGTTSAGTLSGTVEDSTAFARVRIEPLGDNAFKAIFADGSTLHLDLRHADRLAPGIRHLSLTVDGKRESLLLTHASPSEWNIDHAGVHRTLTLEEKKTRHSFRNTAIPQLAAASLLAPMPATIVEILVGETHIVDEGQPLLRIEAMKMVMTLSAPARRMVRTLHVAQGESVPAGHLLVTFGDVG